VLYVKVEIHKFWGELRPGEHTTYAMEICSKVGLSFFPYLTLKHSFSVFRYQFLGQSERISAGCSYGTRSLALFGCELMVLEDYNSVGVSTKAVSRCAPLSLSPSPSLLSPFCFSSPFGTLLFFFLLVFLSLCVCESLYLSSSPFSVWTFHSLRLF